MRIIPTVRCQYCFMKVQLEVDFYSCKQDSSSTVKFRRASCWCSAPHLLTRDFKLHTQWSSNH